jgi:hypothetical protein
MYRDTPAYLVATVDARTFKTIRIGCYSSPADRLAVHDPNERFVDIASASGTSYGDAHDRMIRWARYAGYRITWTTKVAGA